MGGKLMRQTRQTMWWVNGPLKVNDTVPVLVFPTNVTGFTPVDVRGIIGSRSAWTLAFIKTRSLLPPDPLATMTSSIPVADNFEFALTFNYDQTSDLLLNATADIHIGFGEETFIQPTACGSSATTVCLASPVPILTEFGIDVQASLKLISTTLDLTQRLTPTGSSDSGSGSSLGGGSGTSPGPLTGSGSGSGPSTSSGPNSSPGSGYNPASGITTTGPGQPTTNPAQPQT